MNLSLAPLHGVTNRTFRSLWFRHFGGFDRVFAPFIVATPSAPLKRNFFKDLVGDPSWVPPLIPQILGNDAGSFIDACETLARMGYTSVNWNLGCPFPMVAKKMRGSGLLPYPERVARMLDEICSKNPLPVSVKLRLGRMGDDEIDALLPVLWQYPLEEIILHPRTGIQMYTGAADIDRFCAVSKRLEDASPRCIPLVYNGDIFDLSSYRLIARRVHPVAAFMIGRGVLRDPFLPADIRASLEDPSMHTVPQEERAGGVKLFMEDMFEAWQEILHGPAHVLDKMKELWSWLGPSFSGCDRERLAIKRSKTLDEYQNAQEALFERGHWAPVGNDNQ